MVEQSSELDCGRPVALEFGQFLGVRPDAVLGVIRCALGFSVGFLCARVVLGVLRPGGVCGGLTTRCFVEGPRYARPRAREESGGGGTPAVEDGRYSGGGRRAYGHSWVGALVLWVSQRPLVVRCRAGPNTVLASPMPDNYAVPRC